MSETPQRAALRQRWLAEFGDRFSAAEYESALDDVETFRRCAQRIAREPLDQGEMPFSNLLPEIGPKGARR
jgi:hypothetical protein